MGLKSIATHADEQNIRTRDGGRLGIAAVHRILTKTTYKAEHATSSAAGNIKSEQPPAAPAP